MRRIWFALQCDDKECGTLFPMSRTGIHQPVDGAIYTWSMLRAEAKKTGWQRYGGKDYCPACEQSHRNQAAREKGGE